MRVEHGDAHVNNSQNVKISRMPSASPAGLDVSALAFVAIPLALVGTYFALVRRAWLADGAPSSVASRHAAVCLIASAMWLGLTWQVAASGILRDWDRRPPPLAFLIGGVFAIAILVAFGRSGTRIARRTPLWWLVGIQGFRLPLELAMHDMASRGVMPSVMSYSGRNFDILTGTTAIVLAFMVRVGLSGRRTVWLWNVCGLMLLVNVIGVALLATPVFRYFGPDQLNIWVTYPPFVWLPTVLVLAALAGHLLVWRAIARRQDD
jgi:small-conductance mechanosensitive channel